MLTFNVYLLVLHTIAMGDESAAYTPTDYILLNCGASSSSGSILKEGRKWITDEGSKFFIFNSKNTSFASTASRQDHVTCLKFLRLYFYPVQYSGFDGSTSFFYVTANDHLLLQNFSAYLNFSSEDNQAASLIKEFMVPCFKTEKLNVTFWPSPNSLAFVNGIEVVSMSKNMYVKHQDNSVSFVNSKIPFDIPDATAFETVYLLKVGRATVANYSKDTPAYTAPAVVYTTSRTMGRDPYINMNYNLTWNFDIDGGFNYLLRLHFCETLLEVTEAGQRPLADVIYCSGGKGIPVYRDYVLLIPSEDSSKQTLWLALHPNEEVGSMFVNAILNSLEIFRLNKLDGSLAVPNPESTSPLPDQLCQCFTLAEIQAATNDFDDAFIIGHSRFGNVYKGFISRIKSEVAIKRLNSMSQQGAREFWTEIQLLSQLRYVNLVSLIGYCDDNEMILVYEYMANGIPRDHLYNTKKNPLSWKQRLKICIGAACGLDYLHSEAIHRIIHRDVKSTNILLDEQYVAKISGFDLSKMSPISMTNVPLTTVVKGTFRYMDPEYYKRLRLTEKLDVYSFGMVLFEVLFARAAVDSEVEYSQISLADWVRKCVANESINESIDPLLKGKISPSCLRTFSNIAENCIRENG
ncbi:hypothetical protein ERO13_D07G084733v2 [Gossypium hirsutum]|nr:hypothetical protein ERO13_D07G084733v2 [Gossypium hirsutum]